jgi:hypothetical protein
MSYVLRTAQKKVANMDNDNIQNDPCECMLEVERKIDAENISCFPYITSSRPLGRSLPSYSTLHLTEFALHPHAVHFKLPFSINNESAVDTELFNCK